MDFSNNRFNWVFVATLLAAFASLSNATSGIATRALQDQEIGTDICFCAPNTYEFTLDFALTCPPVNITLGDAVKATTCMVSPFGAAGVADLVPVSVSSVEVLELNQNLQVMVQELIQPNEAFLDGDTFSYVSFAAIPGEIVKPEDLPRAIQLNIQGVNAGGEEIINVYLITFTNSCGAYPVLFEGQWAGWTRFSDLGPPSQDLCPQPTPSPTPSPTLPPTAIEMSMSMSMSMNMGLEQFSIEDLLDGEFEYQEYSKAGKAKAGKSKGKGKGEKKRKSKGKGDKKESEKIGKPNAKDGKAKDGKGKDEKGGKPYGKDGKAKDGKSKDGKSKDGKSKDGKSKDGKAKDGKAKDGKGKGWHKEDNKISKDGSKDGKSHKAKGGEKFGKPYDNSKGKKEKSKDGSKAGKADKSKDGAKGGKSDKSKAGKDKSANKLTKPGSNDGKSKDGSKAGKSEKTKDGKGGEPYGKGKAGKSYKAKDSAKAGKSYKYEGDHQKEAKDAHKETNKLKKSEKSKGKGGNRRLRI